MMANSELDSPGHVLRRGKMERLLTTGNLQGHRDRGRQIDKIADGLKEWHRASSSTQLKERSPRIDGCGIQWRPTPYLAWTREIGSFYLPAPDSDLLRP